MKRGDSATGGREKPLLMAAADTGGTFTDVLVVGPEGRRAAKVPSTPSDPSVAVLEGLRRVLGAGTASVLVHGSTVATNALLERRGRRTAFLTTRGFEDVIEIGRQSRSGLYELEPEPRHPVIGREDRFGADERVLADGSVERSLDPEEAHRWARDLKSRGYEAVAVGFLHAWIRPDNEQAAAAALREEGLQACASHELLAEYREFERFTTATVNAFLLPVMADYLQGLDARAGAGSLRIMQSGGGTCSASRAAREPVRAILSGPAGGVIGAYRAAVRSGWDRVLTLDMGGTSTDVSLCPGSVLRRPDFEFQGLPIRTGVLDIHAVGAGGGSIARRDAGGALRVGPRSAGADPGPCCYGRGGREATVTDANLLLGLLDPERPLADELRLQPAAAEEPVDRLAAGLGLGREETCLGIRRVVNASMVRALRVISIQRGQDPREFGLVAFGGAGGLHAVDLAEALQLPRVIVPADAGVLSAQGMLQADLLRIHTRSLLRVLDAETQAAADRTLDKLAAAALEELRDEGGEEERCVLARSLDLRYVGQSWELELPAGDDLSARFHAAHLEAYGYRDSDRPVEIVNVRVTGTCTTEFPSPEPAALSGPDPAPARCGEAPVRLLADGAIREVAAHHYDRAALLPGMRIAGPAVVHEATATVWIPPGWQSRMDPWRALIVERGT